MSLENGGVSVWTSGNSGIFGKASEGDPEDVIAEAVGADTDDVPDGFIDDVPVGVGNDDIPVSVEDDGVPVGVGNDDVPVLVSADEVLEACRAP
eukprot:2153884-Pyramimonas_sp.AAC.1